METGVTLCKPMATRFPRRLCPTTRRERAGMDNSLEVWADVMLRFRISSTMVPCMGLSQLIETFKAARERVIAFGSYLTKLCAD